MTARRLGDVRLGILVAQVQLHVLRKREAAHGTQRSLDVGGTAHVHGVGQEVVGGEHDLDYMPGYWGFGISEKRCGKKK
jgi:hypothetical protein